MLPTYRSLAPCLSSAVQVLVGSTATYDALAYEACAPGVPTDLPDTPLFWGYPCAAPAAHRLAYTLARCPQALLDMLMLRNHSAWLSVSLTVSILESLCVGRPGWCAIP